MTTAAVRDGDGDDETDQDSDASPTLPSQPAGLLMISQATIDREIE